MGRTDPTFRTLLEGMKSRWGAYRRALRRRDQPHFDRLFEHADAHADAAGYLNPADPFDPVLLSMLLEHEKRIRELEAARETDDEIGDETDDEMRDEAGAEIGDGTEDDAVQG